MQLHPDIPMKNFVTMRLGGNAKYMVDAHTSQNVMEICTLATQQQLPVFVLGGGSNTLVHDEGFNGIVMRNLIKEFTVLADTPQSTTIKVGAGENWDEFVKRTVEMGLQGVECLSAIPGTVGASPVQNVGAYGQDVAETITEVEAYDIKNGAIVILSNEECRFSYRDSIFRGDERGRYVILSVTFSLLKGSPHPPFYKAVQDYFDARNITLFTNQAVRDAVIAIRTEKLPDPAISPNTGSFFKNAIVENWQLTELRKIYPDIPSYEMPDGTYKIPTGWLIEHAGLKGQVLHGIKVHDKNALVLINESATSFADLAAARDEIIGIVRDTYRIIIEQEPLEI